MTTVRAIAIHLPQFHPTPENNKWWGEGFTEWTNVTKAKPLFPGHDQPKLPSDLGFYDLRLPETREQQAELARENGIHGFCYYHYWFSGQRILGEPVNRILRSHTPDFPFMLFWANETWSRRWLGEEKDILLKQEYSDQDDVAHATWLCLNAFNDPRYIKIGERPAFIIYRPQDLPSQQKTVQTIKRVASEHGIPEPFVIASNSHTHELDGFDHVLNFEPQLSLLPDAFIDGFKPSKLIRNLKLGIFSGSLKVYDYADTKRRMAEKVVPYPYIPCVFVGWDNTARKNENGIVIVNQKTADFKASLIAAKSRAEANPPEEQIVFINAWNEWAEGNVLEPSLRDGHAYLEAVREVFAPRLGS